MDLFSAASASGQVNPMATRLLNDFGVSYQQADQYLDQLEQNPSVQRALTSIGQPNLLQNVETQITPSYAQLPGFNRRATPGTLATTRALTPATTQEYPGTQINPQTVALFGTGALTAPLASQLLPGTQLNPQSLGLYATGIRSDVDTIQIRNLFDNYQAALNSGNLDQIVSLFDPEAVLVWNNNPSINGAFNIRAAYAVAIKKRKIKSQNIKEIDIFRSTAIVEITHSENKKRDIFVLEKSPQWKIVLYTSNMSN